MKRGAGCLVLGAWCLSVTAAAAPRNPFWPIDYAGEATEIAADSTGRTVRPPAPAPLAPPNAEAQKRAAAEAAAKARAVAEAAEKRARETAAKVAKAAPPPPPTTIGEADWQAARKALKIGNPARFVDGAGVTHISLNINGNIYADGEYVSVTHGKGRFTWRIRGVENGASLKLVRVRARPVDSKEKGTKK